jgi:predicted nuclease of predicted toxin-antitoxin system
MADSDILAWALAENRLLLTMDKDFGELVFLSGRSHAGVLLLRMEDAGGAGKIAVVHDILANHGPALLNRFSVYQDGRLRIR